MCGCGCVWVWVCVYVCGTLFVLSSWIILVGTHGALTQRQHDTLAEVFAVRDVTLTAAMPELLLQAQPCQRCNSHCCHVRAIATGAAQTACLVETTLASRLDRCLTGSFFNPETSTLVQERHPYIEHLTQTRRGQ